jgi:hypothetical protein
VLFYSYFRDISHPQVIAQLKGEGASVILAASDASSNRGLLDAVFTIDRGAIEPSGPPATCLPR